MSKLLHKNEKVNTCNEIFFLPNPLFAVNIEENFQNEFSKLQLVVLNRLFYFCSKFQNTYVSQEKLAILSGCSRATVNRLVFKLEKYGIIRSTYRHMETSLYKMSPFFCDFYVRKKLSKLFKSFVVFPVFWLGSITALGDDMNSLVTQTYISKYLNKKTIPNLVYFDYKVEEQVPVRLDLKPKKLETCPRAQVLDRITTSLNLTRDERDRLGRFPTNILTLAIGKLGEVLRNSEIKSKKGYFYGICKTLTDKVAQKKTVVEKKVEVDNLENLRSKAIQLRVVEKAKKLSEDKQEVMRKLKDDERHLLENKEEALSKFDIVAKKLGKFLTGETYEQTLRMVRIKFGILDEQI